ncbi:hypothetical protein EV383_1780 [Pseudonocardia sediminis]|uniref:Uncharacterized protein n=1 Tax=Pseudonocardia sediminis TaxID=1397368 RepID=A0A4Q7UT04_PSEST|nr:hypothetical protein [Pseudonocardia sediminis]RZT84922.1 hypothetical protein EV383_1780 [Pseudonocardia sediminis]
MRDHERALLGTVAGMHLLFAVIALVAGVGLASPIALALVALAAFALRRSGMRDTPDRGHPQLGRSESTGWTTEWEGTGGRQ